MSKTNKKNKFKVGDIVKGNNPHHYRITNSDMTKGEVTEVRDDGYINIKVLEHRTRTYEHCCSYNVNSKYFDLVNRNVKPIVIYADGDKVIALNKNTGKKAVATCHPSDEFDFLTGAKLAFERLVDEVKIVKQDSYQAGDKVKIVSEWNDKTNENSHGEMDKYLGTIMTIKYRDIYGKCCMVEDNGHWIWNKHCILGKVVSSEDSEPKKEELKPYNGKVVCIGGCPPYTTVGKIYEFVDGYMTYDHGASSCMRMYTFEQICKDFRSKFIEVVE